MNYKQATYCGIGVAIVVYIIYLALGLYYASKADKLQSQMEYIDASVDGSINTTVNSVISIETAHSQSVSHRGVLLFVVNENEELLLFKRSSSAVTCPNTWYAAGEHTKHNETYLATAYRGLKEELGLKQTQIFSIVPLFKEPLFLNVVYSGAKFKQDLQWTQSFLVRVKQSNILSYNHETSLMQWKPIKTCLMWVNNVPSRICSSKSFLYSSEELNATNVEGSFKEVFEMNIKRIKLLL